MSAMIEVTASPPQSLLATAPLLIHATRRTPKRPGPFKGDIRLGPDSGLRKLMRASRRGKLSDDRARLIAQAMAAAGARLIAQAMAAAGAAAKYLSAHARRAAERVA